MLPALPFPLEIMGLFIHKHDAMDLPSWLNRAMVGGGYETGEFGRWNCICKAHLLLTGHWEPQEFRLVGGKKDATRSQDSPQKS